MIQSSPPVNVVSPTPNGVYDSFQDVVCDPIQHLVCYACPYRTGVSREGMPPLTQPAKADSSTAG